MDLFEATNAFGRFEPASSGLWLNLDPILDREDSELTRLSLQTFLFPPGEGHRTYLSQVRSEEDLAFAGMSFSVAAHESRHFSDLLATPYGSVMARQYTRASMYYLLLRKEILFRNQKIVVPISDWCRDPGLFEQLYGIPAPSQGVRGLESLLSTMYEKLAGFDRGSLELDGQKLPTASSILEGTAVLTQCSMISHALSGDACGAFTSYIGSQAPPVYRNALGLMLNVLGSDLPHELRMATLVAALYGNFQNADPGVPRYPTDIFVELLLFLRDCRDSHSGPIIFSQWVRWIDAYYIRRCGQGLHEMCDQATFANKGVLAALEQEVGVLAHQLDEDPSDAHWLLDVYSHWITAQEEFGSWVIENMDSYCDEKFCFNSEDQPAPIIFIQTEHGLPIDSQLLNLFYVQSERAMHLSSDMISALAANMGVVGGEESLRESLIPYDEFLELRRKNSRSIERGENDHLDEFTPTEGVDSVAWSAHVLSPRSTMYFGRKLFDEKEWQQRYNLVSAMRLFAEGTTGGMCSSTADEMIAIKAMLGGQIFTADGPVQAAKIDVKAMPELLQAFVSIMQDGR